MEINIPRFDNLQNELRKELDPQGALEEEIFRSVLAAANNRRYYEADARIRYQHDRAFFLALRELRLAQARRANCKPAPPAPPRRNVLRFPKAA